MGTWMTTVFSLVHTAAKPVLSLGAPPGPEMASRHGALPDGGKPGMRTIAQGHIQLSVRMAFSGGTQPVLARAAADRDCSALLVGGSSSSEPAVRSASRDELMDGVLSLLPAHPPGNGEFAMIHGDARGGISPDYRVELEAVKKTISLPRKGTAMLGVSVSGHAAFDHERPSLLVLDNDDGRYILGLINNQHGGVTLLHHPASDDVISTWVTNAISDYEALAS